MTREMRFVVITSVVVAAGVIGFYLLARHLEHALVERPHAASVKQQLRALAAGEAAHFNQHRLYTAEVVRVWVPPSDGTGQGIQLRVIAADANGYIAEGRSVAWEGRCVLAFGSAAGDSLPPGEPVCSRD